MMREIDETDRKILSILSGEPELSQIELSKRLNISQPAVSARIHKLEEKGVLAHLIGADVLKAQVFLAKVDVSTTNVEKTLEFLDRCPLYLNSFLTSGRYNITILLMGENIRSLMSCVDSHLRPHLPIKGMEFNLIVTPVRPFIVPLRPSVKKGNAAPCDAKCEACRLYASGRCLGCPASTCYRGSLL